MNQPTHTCIVILVDSLLLKKLSNDCDLTFKKVNKLKSLP